MKKSMQAESNPLSKKNKISGFWGDLKNDLRRNKGTYAIAVPGILFYIIFAYLPMFGVAIAFKDYNPSLGVLGSKWVGFKHFASFFESVYAGRLIKNTLTLSFYGILFVFPVPIILALLINEVKSTLYKKTVQTITYLPHFISMVVICGMITSFTSPTGFITKFCGWLGFDYTNMLYEVDLFRGIYVVSEIWQKAGWDSIIFLAAISGLDMDLYEAASIDGAKKLRQLWHITLPGIAPTIVIMLILRIGSIMSMGADKVILLYNPVTYEKADIISSYVYRVGLIRGDHSYSAAVGFFNSIVSLILVLSANYVSKKVTDSGLF